MRGSTQKSKFKKGGEKGTKPTKEKRKQPTNKHKKKGGKGKNRTKQKRKQPKPDHTKPHHRPPTKGSNTRKQKEKGLAKLNILTLFKTEFASELKANSEKHEQFTVLPSRI
ncbi:unnamed protein product [Polarella glacialis]|uniref:Uncharacterized protein n=1 Tax=Polarella glacialis TaxID=89957 RepID=A0A813DRI5_POLGL|nr:unnamed protein product [Polarella glacialis]